MAAIKLLYVLICTTFICGLKLPEFHLLTPLSSTIITQQSPRSQLVKTAEAELGVREEGGNNKGSRIAEYLAVVNLHRPEPWCAAFLSFIFKQNGYRKPRSGWSPDFFPKSRLVTDPLPGNIIGLYFTDLKRIAHVGIIVEQRNDWIYTIEGNTQLNGGREGDGVFRRMRHRRTIYKIADWIRERRIIP